MSNDPMRPRTNEGIAIGRFLAPLYRKQLKEQAAELREEAEKLEKLALTESDYDLVRSTTYQYPVTLPTGDVLWATEQQQDAMFIGQLGSDTRLSRWALKVMLEELVEEFGHLDSFVEPEEGE